MSYLIRVLLPDTPGSLGTLAESFGLIDANIHSVDVVHTYPDGTVVDDIVVSLPHGALPELLVSTAEQIDGVHLDSLRPFSGTLSRRGQIAMLAAIAGMRKRRGKALAELVKHVPQTASCGWCIVFSCSDQTLSRVAASSAAPEDDSSSPPIIIDKARRLDPVEESWIPPRWAMLDSTLAATPLFGTDLVLVIGRPGGPDFIDSEVDNLSALGTIIGSLLSDNSAH